MAVTGVAKAAELAVNNPFYNAVDRTKLYGKVDRDVISEASLKVRVSSLDAVKGLKYCVDKAEVLDSSEDSEKLRVQAALLTRGQNNGLFTCACLLGLGLTWNIAHSKVRKFALAYVILVHGLPSSLVCTSKNDLLHVEPEGDEGDESDI